MSDSAALPLTAVTGCCGLSGSAALPLTAVTGSHLGGVRDEEDDEVGLADGLEHLAERAALLREAHRLGQLPRGRVTAEAHLGV